MASLISKKKGSASDESQCAYCGTVAGKKKLSFCSRCKLSEYCCRECQKADWKNHKPLCIPKEDRKPSSIDNDPVVVDMYSKKEACVECVICMTPITSSTKCTLPCSHSFHNACVSRLRSAASAQACPLCRSDLPPGPEQAFTKGMQLYYAYIENNSKGLKTKEMKEMLRQIVQYWKAAAEEGHTQAQFNMGSMFEHGHGVAQNYKKAFDWFSKAANQGHAAAQYNMGFIFHNGQGVTQNLKKAVEWYSKAAEQGDADAQFNLGKMYALGLGVTQSYKKAFELYSKAADQGCAGSQCNLGIMFADGLGVARNDKMAVELYSKAADQGNAAAQFSLGRMYARGLGVAQNNKKTLELLTKAADQGQVDAQLSLGIMFCNGEGVAIDYKKAVKWFSKAADQGNVQAQNTLRNLKKHLGLFS